MITLPFKKKKKEKEVKPKKESIEKEKSVIQKKKSLKKEKVKKATGKSEIAFKVLKKPIVSEKGTILEKKGKYIFKVFPTANKIEIKKAVEKLYGVQVEKINIIKVPGKKRRLGRTEGWKPGYKKAIVSIEKGRKIEVISR